VLPKKDANGNPITYTKYDVNPAPQHGATRGKERMVVGSDGRAYYTRDHYKTFEEFKY
jgi:ribonuclease T1